MKHLTALYGLFFIACLTSLVTLMGRSGSKGMFYYKESGWFLAAWIVMIACLMLGNILVAGRIGRLMDAMVYALIAWGILQWFLYETTGDYAFVLPLIGMIVTAVLAYWLDVNTASAHLFLAIFCIAVLFVFFTTEGKTLYKFFYAFGPEGARDAVSKTWFVICIGYVGQLLLNKIRSKTKGMTVPRYSLQRVDQPTRPQSTHQQPTPARPSATPVRKLPPVNPNVPDLGIKVKDTKPTSSKANRLGELSGQGNYFNDGPKNSKLKEAVRKKINKD